MNFSNASKVLETIRAGDDAEWERGENRRKINDTANCVPPLSPELAKKMGIKVNVQFGALMQLVATARRQYRTAFFGTGRFFTVKIPKAPVEYQSEWETFITGQINDIMNGSTPYFDQHESKWAAVVLHGLGPTIYYDPDAWLAEYLAIEDLRIPTDTKTDLSNLDWFAARKMWTVFELVNEVFPVKETENSKKWDKKAIKQILKNYKSINTEAPENQYDWETTPEKLAELVRQNGGYYSSDALPKITFWHFYFRDDTEAGKKGWYMVVVPESSAIRGQGKDEFLWKSDEPIAEKREHILQCQLGDLCNKAPFLIKSMRSLGFALMEPCFYDNLTICRAIQHLNDNMDVWLRTTDPADKARPQIQEFGNYKMLRSGLQVVPQAERHQIDHDMLEVIMAKTKQLQQEVSQSYTQQTDTGTRKEQTAFETNVKVQQVNAMMSGLLVKAFKYETAAYREICRRFCRMDSEDDDVKNFQKECNDAGIPRKWLDSRLWKIEPVTPLGMGNPTVAQASAQQLLSILPLLDPTAQQEVKHEIVLTFTQDPRKAARWVPLGKQRGLSEGAKFAQSIFGTLMTGIPLPPAEGLPLVDQIDALLPMFAGKLHQFATRNGMITQDEDTALQNVYAYLASPQPPLGLVTRLAQNPNEKQRVKQYMDQLGKLDNERKGLAQRGQEAMQAQAQGNGNGGLDPETQAKIHTTTAMAAAKLHGKQQADALKMKQSAKKFVAEERRKDASAFAEIQRQGVKTKAEVASKRMKAFDEKD